ncbi:hypothetical protein VB715_08035 [Crocosphaera sp. UHCC 0190]|uniref:hypothetical protein n=1 Tax=Crocosphaera sp. UHCC 0190 TaxID=3110246 RepID=UPI002B212C03|nr:hypothetical protein [Crocosphaera sp. UHCC 0190]MEA5509711.1 hypothetical protein [Crocosphaera sp. UHCC 0190]
MVAVAHFSGQCNVQSQILKKISGFVLLKWRSRLEWLTLWQGHLFNKPALSRLYYYYISKNP